MTESTAQVVKSLFVTLRRSFAGTPWFHRRILEALGLKHRHQCVEKPNNSSIRGMLLKVPHMVIIETDRMRFLRAMKAYHEQLPRTPWILHHDPLLVAAAAGEVAAAAPQPALPAGGAGGAAAGSGSGAVTAAAAQRQQPLLPPPPPPRLTTFAAQQLREHVQPVGLEGYEALRGPPQVPLKYFQERASRYRAKVLTERGIFSAEATWEHRNALKPGVYRRRVGIRD